MTLRNWAILAATVVTVGWAATQAQADAAQTVANQIQSNLGVFVYPKGSQDSATQAKDTVECYDSAKQRSGIDPSAPPPTAAPVQQEAGGAVRGSARGAARGAAIGAIAGDAGKGAAIGAAGGAMRGRSQQRRDNAEAQEEGQEQAAALGAEQKATFNKAFGACMDARNYSVK